MILLPTASSESITARLAARAFRPIVISAGTRQLVSPHCVLQRHAVLTPHRYWPALTGLSILQSRLFEDVSIQSSIPALALQSCRLTQRASSDLARRHTKKCSTDGGSVVFPPCKSGKRRSACDRCSLRKLSCDAATPCSRCASASLECTYQRLETPASSTVLDVRVDDTVAVSHRAIESNSNPTNHDTKIPIDFLLGFTHPTAYGTSAAVVADDTNPLFVQNENDDLSLQPYLDNGFFLTDGFLWDQADSFPALFEMMPPDLCEDSPLSEGPSQIERQAALARRASEMVEQLAMTYESVKRNNPGTAITFDLRLAEFVFEKTNLSQFVSNFFQRLYANIPIIHPPTFHIETTPLPLLLAVFLFGSLCCTPQDSALSAREFFDLAEEYIFSFPSLKRMSMCQESSQELAEEVGVFQAALIMEVIQNGSSNTLTRRRLRLERHPCLVMAMRTTSLFGAKRRFPLDRLSGVDWQDFILDDTLLRLAAWTFFTDSVFAVFYNKPPEVSISEMTGDFPCEGGLFEVGTAAEYERVALRLASSASSSRSLCELTSLFIANASPGPQKHLGLNATAPELLFCIVGRFYCFCSPTHESRLTLLERCNRWRWLRGPVCSPKRRQRLCLMRQTDGNGNGMR